MEKQPYEPPILVRHRTGLMNKFGRVPSLAPLDNIDGVAVADLIDQYGSPLFVFSEKTMVERYRDLHDAFAVRYPKVRIAWSYKTNYLDAVCRVFHREGAWAEVVSDFEYDKALRLGVAPERIHINGPYKTEPFLERALRAGSIIHIDHFDELAAAERVAARLDLQPEVAIRINMSAETIPHWGRFGFNLESGQARDAVSRLIGGGRLRLAGLHCHLGTFILDPEPYRRAASELARFANSLRSDLGVRLSFIDLGGGFASHNTLKAQYLPGDQSTPSFTRYAEAIIDGLSALDARPDELPTLVLEHGRALIDDAGYLISSVLANKRLPDGTRGVVLDAGVNLLFTSFWYRHDVVPAQPLHGMPEPAVLYGPLCMNIDVVRDAMLLPPVKPGDRLVFRHAGAYNVTQWMQFITYRPAVVLIHPDGNHAAIRRRETLETVVASEERPPWQ
jgi:diaminopimelate decarboxylase